jgi:hypothetical protein
MSGGEEKIPGDKEKKAIRVCPPSLLLFRFFFLLTHKTFRILFFFVSSFPYSLQKLLSPPFDSGIFRRRRKIYVQIPKNCN